MINPYLPPALLFDMARQYQKLWWDTTAVLNYRVPLLHKMATDPAAAADPLNWFEVNRMVTEKAFAFGQAAWLSGLAMSATAGRPASLATAVRRQQRAGKPVRDTLSANASRVHKRR